MRQNLLPKPCNCPESNFEWISISQTTTEGIFSVHSYKQVFRCKKCQKDWGLPRNQERELQALVFKNEMEFESLEIQAIQAIYFQLLKKVAEKKLISLIKNFAIEQKYFIQKLLQGGFLNLKETNNAQIDKIKKTFYWSSEGESWIRKNIMIHPKEEQAEIMQKIIKSALDLDLSIYSPIQSQLKDILINQSIAIEEENPGWQLHNKRIVPQNSGVKKPLYLYLGLILTTWYRNFREGITYREISCKAFTNSPYISVKDPSKVIHSFQNDFEAFICNAFNIKSTYDAGLIENIHTIYCSGEFEILQKDTSVHQYGVEAHVFSTVFFNSIQTFNIQNKILLLVENLAVFTQMVQDKFSSLCQCAVIYLNGKPSRALQTMLSLVAESNPQIAVWAWVDQDLGGCQIFQFLGKIFSPNQISPVRIPDTYQIPFTKVQHNQLVELLKIQTTAAIPFKKFIDDIMSKGKIEQEYLLDKYMRLIGENVRK